MTVADNTSRNQYTATSGQTVFAYTFEIVDKDDIVVLKNGTTLSEGTDYTVSNVGNDNGGNVTLTVGATTGDILTLYRDMPYVRTQNYTNAGDFLASEVNSDFDNLWLAGEQTQRSFSQSIRKPITDSDSISMELPEAASRINSFLTFDSTGAVSVESLSSANAPSNVGRQQFTGNGSTTVFALAAEAGSGAGVFIYIDGVYQESDTYTISGTTLTFTEAPPLNASIEVVSYRTGDINTADANAVTYTPAGTGAVQTTVQTKLRESVSVKDFGAVGDGVTDDTAAIQAAIDAVNSSGGGIVIIPSGNFIVSPSVISGISAYSRQACIVGKDNVALKIDGTVKLKSATNIGSTLAAIVTGLDTGLTNFQVFGSGTINGNSSNVTATQMIGVYLPCVDSVTVTDIRIINMPYLGVQFTTALPYSSGNSFTNGIISGLTVKDIGNIGIQASHSSRNLIISNNTIDTCGDNCIDVYHDNTTSTSDAGVVSITGNTCYAGLTGIFPETSANTNVTGNSIYACTTGIASNRINGQPRNLNISGNTIGACETGASITGDSGGVSLSNNTFDKFTIVGLQMGGSGNVSYVVVSENVFNPNATTTNIITITGSVASFNIIKDNYLLDALHNSANLILNTASTSTANTVEPLKNVNDVQPVTKTFTGGASSSGGTATVTVPSLSAGKLVIKSSAGGSWYSVWSGSFVSDGTGVAVSQDSTIFVSTGNNISSVAGSASSFDVTITFAASGSAGTYNVYAEYF